MLKAIHQYLVNDEQLVNLVGYTPKNQRIHPYVPKNKTDYPYIIFEVYPFQSGSLITQYRCDITALTKDVLLIESIANRLLEMLHFGNRPGIIVNNKTFYRSSHNGGSGINYDPEQKLYEQVLTFNIKSN